MTIDSIWSYPPDSGHVEGRDLTGYGVVGTDGTLGHVEREDGHHGMWHLVVDTGVWLFGRSAVVPVGVVTSVDEAERKISVACTVDEVKEAPRFRTDSETMDPDYLTAVADYYRRLIPHGTTTA
ncbi:PRC-barrel domain containing protein [Streptomyces sp. NPDC057052]|uniref:PRC-barrel domain containing protein n=1 Tax=Streptomyces sp. NPDC057052 TaxID=3346010 RepID=UPI00363B9F28